VGVSAASVTQFARQTQGEKAQADDHAYQLASADLLFSAGLAQYTSFFADIVGLSGAPPDAEIHGLTLLNSYTARLVRQNEVNVREAWLRTELFSQKLAISAGRLDLTNYFDRNAFANDETTQFVSDALVNNPTLGLFGRYGNAEAETGRDRFYSGGFQIQNSLVFYPLDFWGIGYAQTDLATGDQEKMVEGYYNFHISEKLRLSFHLQHAFETPTG